MINFQSFRGRGRGAPLNVTKTVVKQTKAAEFQLLHISILREYLQIELCRDFYVRQVPIDLERVIDDFVFMTFLVGNDFLPHLPTLDISEGAFDRLFGVYKQQLDEKLAATGGLHYLTCNGNVVDFE